MLQWAYPGPFISQPYVPTLVHRNAVCGSLGYIDPKLHNCQSRKLAFLTFARLQSLVWSPCHECCMLEAMQNQASWFNSHNYQSSTTQINLDLQTLRRWRDMALLFIKALTKWTATGTRLARHDEGGKRLSLKLPCLCIFMWFYKYELSFYIHCVINFKIRYVLTKPHFGPIFIELAAQTWLPFSSTDIKEHKESNFTVLAFLEQKL